MRCSDIVYINNIRLGNICQGCDFPGMIGAKLNHGKAILRR